MPNNNGQFNIGGKRQTSQQRFSPSVRGMTGAGPSRSAGGAGKGSTPGLRRGGASSGGSQNTPGLRKKGGGGKGKGLGPARGAVIQDGRVNGIQVRVSAPQAPNPNRASGGIIEASAQERNLRSDMAPDMMAAQSTQMIAGQQARRQPPAGRRGRVTQEAAPGVVQRPSEPIIDAEVIETSALPPGAYWSDRFERYVLPGEPEYSQETAQRMGAVG